MDNEVSVVFKKIKANYSDKENDCDLLHYYFKDALFSFEQGDYEKAFLSGYKIIRESTVVDPKKYVNDKRNGSPSTFCEIRGTLMHSSNKHRRTEVEKIKKINPKLPEYSLEVIERAFEFLQKIC